MKKKVLVIRFSSIGDIVLTTPILRALHRDGFDVHLLTKPNFVEVLKHNPFVEKIFQFDGIGDVLSLLKAEDYHFVADLQNNAKSNLLTFRLGVKHASFPKLNIEKWMLVNFKVNKLPEKHIVERYFEAVAPLQVLSDGDGLDFFIHEKDQLDVKVETGFDTYKYNVVVLGAAHATKQIPEKQLVKIISNSPLPVVLVGGPAEGELGRRLKAKFSERVYSACGRFSLAQSAWLLKQAYHVVTPDTGMMHIAAAMNKTMTVLWGNTIPEFGMYPYLPERNWKSLQVKDLKCRPCSKIGYDKCPKGHFDCMMKQRIGKKVFQLN